MKQFYQKGTKSVGPMVATYGPIKPDVHKKFTTKLGAHFQMEKWIVL
jgi:hypothetical protein